MKLCSSLAGLLILAVGISTANGQATLYWDINGTAPGATFGDGIADGTWDNSAQNWNTDPTGGAAGTISAWTNPADHAVFSAGSDVGNDLSVNGGIITLSAGLNAASVTLEEGAYRFSGGDLNTPQTLIKAGAHLEYLLHTVYNAAAGKITLQGGSLGFSNLGHAGTFVKATQPLEIDGTGIIRYDDTVPRTAADCQCTIYTPAAGAGIFGVGGTSTAGAGTLIKRGAGEIRVQGPQIVNNSFEKLIVEQGLFRVGSSGTIVPESERGFGAAPPSLLTDAITLDGGAIGTSFSTTLHANRGITVTSNGGLFENGGAGVVTIPGPLTGSGPITISGVLLSPTSLNAGVSTGGTTLANAGNVTTFSGNVTVNSSTLTLNQSLTTPRFSGGSVTTTPAQAAALTQNVVTIGTVSIATGMTFTAGSDNTSTSYEGRVIGAGTFRKVGSGTLTLDAGQTDHDPGSTVAEFTGEWTNTGGVIIDGGAIRFGTPLAGFGSTTPVSIAGAATLDMNGINDTFGSLSGGGTVARGANANITLGRGSSDTQTFSGTITGSGSLTKGRALPGGAGDNLTQIMTGNYNFSTVTVNAGALILNGTNTTGAVTVNGGALGGSGSVSGATVVNTGGAIAPGSAGIGTLAIGGGLTLESGSILNFELGAPTNGDLINVTGGTTTINGGTLNIADAGGLANGTYPIIDYVGALGGSVANLALGTTPAGFTFNLVDTGSVINLQVSGAAALIGDYNGNGVVDAADYVLWRKDPNAYGGTPAGYDAWRANFGMTSPGAGSGGGLAAVPEPASLALVMLGLVAVGFGRRSR